MTQKIPLHLGSSLQAICRSIDEERKEEEIGPAERRTAIAANQSFQNLRKYRVPSLQSMCLKEVCKETSKIDLVPIQAVRASQTQLWNSDQMKDPILTQYRAKIDPKTSDYLKLAALYLDLTQQLHELDPEQYPEPNIEELKFDPSEYVNMAETISQLKKNHALERAWTSAFTFEGIHSMLDLYGNRPANLPPHNAKAADIRRWMNDEMNQPLIQKVGILCFPRYNLEVIPEEIYLFSDLETLDLSSNKIKELRPGQFSHLEKLKSLNLRMNEITEIPVGAFSPHISNLSLACNQIKKLRTGVFSELEGPVICLDLSNNQIEEADPGVLARLRALGPLILQRNPIANRPTQ